MPSKIQLKDCAMRLLVLICFGLTLAGCAGIQAKQRQEALKAEAAAAKAQCETLPAGVVQARCLSEAEVRLTGSDPLFGDLYRLRAAKRVQIAEARQSGRISKEEADVQWASVNSELADKALQRRLSVQRADASSQAADAATLNAIAASNQNNVQSFRRPTPTMRQTNCTRTSPDQVSCTSY